MSNTNIPSIEMDEHRFKKLSKKLQKKINEKSSADIKLNVIQESLSEALGFRNLHDIQKNKTVSSLMESSNDILKDLFFSSSIEENVDIAGIILPLINPIENKSKKQRDIFDAPYLILFRLALNLLKKNNDLSQTINSFKNMDIFKIFLSSSDLKNDINKYFELRECSIQALKIDMTTFVPRSSLVHEDVIHKTVIYYNDDYQKVISLINMMTKIKSKNILIYKRNWIANSGSHEKWRYNECIFKGDFYHKSWLHMDSYIKITETLDYLNGNYAFRLSDLILYKINIISPDLDKHIDTLLKVVFDNYEKCLQISSNLEEI